MTSKPKAQLAPLPRTEILVYWVLSFGSHLYSFYQLHRFSKDHEASLVREFQLEKGLLKGFKRDPLDFEWSFWTEWAKKSLLWTLIGHGVVSRLTSTFYPKLRLPALTIYGVLAACSVLGIKGVSLLLVHLSLSFSVAQLRKPALSWAFSLLLLSTLHIQPLQDIQRRWYKSEEEYYLLLFSVAVCGLRFISFSLEHCWSPLSHGGGDVVQLSWLFSYTFYHPFFYNGPVITYKDYTEQMRRPAEESDREESALSYFLLRSVRIIVWWCIAEYMIHVMYMHCIQSNETYIEILPPWALGGLALALVQFFYVKYLVLFGLPSMLATLDNLVPPQLPRCVSIMYSFTGMWRHFDEGLYRWLIRVGLQRQQMKQVIPDVPPPSNTFQLFLGDPEAFPGQMRYIIPPAGSGSTLGSPPWWTCLENLQRKSLQTTSTGSFRREGAVPLLRAPSGCLSFSPYHPTEEAHFSCLYPRSCSLGHYPELMTIGESWNVDELVN
ncbi:protein-cysteine N-palmitoyltransferase HHAT isoform X2 [Amphiprion ocellaris]|uniref:protein-cysteine N-palmitoyltransferase HHAT isoform X2 n=1 Tax=Amphiprion ocellaris TaxID=80972 RepID=UPI0024112E93|nr:protein-cysteine N-palmitoyltransferase HHAT isoform X2 [Amphiprion ocellaris]